MHPIFQLLLGGALFSAIHVSVMALCAKHMAILVLQVVYGAGPTLYARKRLSIKALPFFGNVQMKDTREPLHHSDDDWGAYNCQPVWKQVLLPLSGPLLLLLVSVILLGLPGWHSFLAAFAQIIDGALHPLSNAQDYLLAWDGFARSQPFWLVFALLAIKLSAFNLLPFGGLNGLQALTSLARWGKPYAAWEEPLVKWLLLPGLAVFAAWLVAFGCYCLHFYPT